MDINLKYVSQKSKKILGMPTSPTNGRNGEKKSSWGEVKL